MAEEVDDLEVLFDENTLDIEGERIVVREYRYLDGLRAAAIARPILAGLREHIESLEGPEDLAPEVIDALIGEHYMVWLELIALCVDRSPEWVGSLPDSAGQRLSLAFWGANANFFTRRLVVSAAVAQGMASRCRGAKSSPPSSPPATDETTTISPDGTPGDKSDAITRSPAPADEPAAPT